MANVFGMMLEQARFW